MRLLDLLDRCAGKDSREVRRVVGDALLVEEGRLSLDARPHPERAAFPLEGAPGSAWVLGRSRAADLQLHDQQVSSRHAELRREPGGWALTDLGSTNGTFVEGVRLAPRTPRSLHDGEVVRFGPDAVFALLGPEAAAALVERLLRRAASLGGTAHLASTDAAIQLDHADTPVRATDAAGPGPEHDLLLVCDAAQSVPLPPGAVVVIGRSADCQLTLPHAQVSRAHAEVRRGHDGVSVRDLDSANGTFIGPLRVRDRPVELTIGKVITIGPFQVALQGPSSDLGQTIPGVRALAAPLAGDLAQRPLADLLHEVEAAQSTGALELTAGSLRGAITFRAGSPCSARTSEGLAGEAALRALLALRAGTFIIRHDPQAVGPRQIERSFSDLLLEDFLG